MSQLPESTDPFFLNDRLRAAYGADEVPEPGAVPPPRIWAGVAPHLKPAPVPGAAWRPALLGGTVGALLTALLLWNWLGSPALAPVKGATARTSDVHTPQNGIIAGTVDVHTHQNQTGLTQQLKKVAPTGPQEAQNVVFLPADGPSGAAESPFWGENDGVRKSYESNPGSVDIRGAAVATVAAGTVDILTGLPGSTGHPNSPVPAVLAALVLTETTFAAVPADSARPFRERRRAALLAQRAELTRLRYRTDSLLLGLGVETTEPAADTTTPPHHLTTSNRWSVALAFAPERNFFGLSSPVSDTLSALRRTHETGRAGYNAAVLAEYRLDRRLSVGAGLGLASYGAELRLTDRQTHISTRLDSSISHSATVTTVIRDAYSIRTVRDSLLAPILNANQQVIGYQYLPTTRLDTVWTHLVNTQVDSVTKKIYTPIITTRQEVSARILRPNYRFLTVPLLVRYRLGRLQDYTTSPTAPRWWADVAVGAQLQFFLGGTQASTTDGRTYQTERVGPRGGPFRPFNVALTGAVAFNYALTPRLSASLAPTLRWQVESVYKASTNLSQRPTATGVQFGLKLAF